MQDILDAWFGAPLSDEYGHVRRAWFKKDEYVGATIFNKSLETARVAAF